MKYESKQQQISRSAEQVYEVLSKFSNFTPMLADKVEQWEADDDSCSFVAKGFTMALQMTEKIPAKLIKITEKEGGGSPVPFTFWLQLKEIEPYDTRIRVVLEVELNMMLKMMIGGKMQHAVDAIAQQLAASLNQ